MNTELWRPIEGYEGVYEISNTGKVKRLASTFTFGRWDVKTSVIKVKEKIIKNQLYDIGYEYVVLSHNGKAKKKKIHRLIALAFIPNPLNLPQINHINGIRNDNRIENLEWCDHSHNMKHKFKIGNQSNAGKNNAMAKIVCQLSTGIFFETVKEAADCFKIQYGEMNRIIKGIPIRGKIIPNKFNLSFC